MSETRVVVSPPQRRRRSSAKSTLILLVLLAVAFRIFCGVFTIQPMGAVPEGRTVIVWRASGEPFFNSLDAICLDRMGAVSIMCRIGAIQAAPTDRIILRLPYMRWAYLLSTGGKEFDR